jgi:phosphatidylserine decarboxylase
MDPLMLFLGAILFSLATTNVLYWKAGKGAVQASLTGLWIGMIAGFLAYVTNMTYSLDLVGGIILDIFYVLLVAFTAFTLWFFRDPERNPPEREGVVVAPADGKVKYIREIHKGMVPVSEKNDLTAPISELSKTSILEEDGYLVGIVMSITDVHKNRAPIAGEVVLSEHTPGKFMSLKKWRGIANNERNTTVIKGDILVGVVQIASRLVRRIDSYVRTGQKVTLGQRIGMIKFSSQTDLILPRTCCLRVKVGEQVYGGKTVIAEYLKK